MNDASVTRIGRCNACAMRPRVIAPDTTFCIECIEVRGLHWSQTAARVRRDPAFRQQVLASIRSQTGKRLFLSMFGDAGDSR